MAEARNVARGEAQTLYGGSAAMAPYANDPNRIHPGLVASVSESRGSDNSPTWVLDRGIVNLIHDQR